MENLSREIRSRKTPTKKAGGPISKFCSVGGSDGNSREHANSSNGSGKGKNGVLGRFTTLTNKADGTAIRAEGPRRTTMITRMRTTSSYDANLVNEYERVKGRVRDNSYHCNGNDNGDDSDTSSDAEQLSTRTTDFLNLTVIRRYTPLAASIMFTAPYAVIYEFSRETASWSRRGIEGGFFVVALSDTPVTPYQQVNLCDVDRFGVVILNRRGIENFMLELPTPDNIDITQECIMLQCFSLGIPPQPLHSSMIVGIWIYSDHAYNNRYHDRVDTRAVDPPSTTSSLLPSIPPQSSSIGDPGYSDEIIDASLIDYRESAAQVLITCAMHAEESRQAREIESHPPVLATPILPSSPKRSSAVVNRRVSLKEIFGIVPR